MLVFLGSALNFSKGGCPKIWNPIHPILYGPSCSVLKAIDSVNRLINLTEKPIFSILLCGDGWEIPELAMEVLYTINFKYVCFLRKKYNKCVPNGITFHIYIYILYAVEAVILYVLSYGFTIGWFPLLCLTTKWLLMGLSPILSINFMVILLLLHNYIPL